MATFIGTDDDETITPSLVSPTVTRDPAGSFPSNAADTLLGGGGNDTLEAGDGNDTLDGGSGNDHMRGGRGDDLYIVDSGGDLVDEDYYDGSIDAVQSSITFILSRGLENLTLTGTAAIDGYGNEYSNTIIGNDAGNILSGGDGNDNLDGGAGDDTLQGGLNNDTLTGGDGNDTLRGNGNDDLLDGGAGADFMDGGNGGDTYIVDDEGDVVQESNSHPAPDLVMASVSFVLGSGIENLTLTGGADINGTGNGGNNVIDGNSGANILDGFSGDDRLTGGDGDDTLIGGEGRDRLDGGAGADAMIGGAGDDDYYLDNVGDTVSGESASGGNDTVFSSHSHTLAANFENLYLSGASAIDGIGNDGDNTIVGSEADNVLTGGGGHDTLYGNSGADTLTGGDGDDLLHGGAGTDTMNGGLGDDLYFVDNAGDVIELDAGGIDTVHADISYTLSADLENMQIGGNSVAPIDGTGNAAANVIADVYGRNNVIWGLAGDDTLDGFAGDDTLYGGEGADDLLGGSGNDMLDGGDGDDELDGDGNNDTLQGGDGNDELLGNWGNDTLAGGDGNDTLDGGRDADVMSGGLGDDSYVVDHVGDVVNETASGGFDTVRSSVTHALSANVENLTLTGSVAINGTGNAGANLIEGNSGNNTIDGAAGADDMRGGLGNDLYIVDDAGDIVTETPGGGVDTVQTSLSFTLAADFENLTLTGASNADGTGNGQANSLVGNSGDNVLSGLGGNDTMIAGLGDDTLDGGDGNDLLDGGAGADQMNGGDGDDLYIVDNAGDSITEAAGGGTDSVEASVTFTLEANLEKLRLTGAASIDGGGNDLGNILTGNSGDNVLSGFGGNDTLDGGTGADQLNGGAGNDLYIVNGGDTVFEKVGQGLDKVQSSVSFVLPTYVENLTLVGTADIDGVGNGSANGILGNKGNNALSGLDGDDRLAGDEGNDTLDGGTGADEMYGGEGDDLYVVDDAGDYLAEGVDRGFDTVQSSVSLALADNVENLTLTGSDSIDGTGNGATNVIVGNSGSNLLSGGGGNDRLDGEEGDDILDGGAGVDQLNGGAGNDLYIVDNAADVVGELAGGGIDTVQSSLAYNLGTDVENLALTGTGAIDGTGNGLDNAITGNGGNNLLRGMAGDDTLDGGNGNDTLDGGTGADQMSGGLGNDTYVVDNIGDSAAEADADGGVDKVNASVSHALSANVENLILTGAVAIDGTGNASDNVIKGNGGDNILLGLDGSDTLEGGTGNDTLDGGAGIDTASYASATAGVTVSLLIAGAQDTLGAGTDTLLGIEGLTGSAFADTLTGNGAANVLEGGKGNDRLDGGAGTDTASYASAAAGVTVSLLLAGPQDTQGAGTDTLLGIEGLTGSTFADTLTGNGAANALTGGAAGDTLNGGGGDDTLDGGAAGDMLNGSSGIDTASYASAYSGVTASLANPALNTGGAAGDVYASIENLTGSQYADILTGSGSANTLDGGQGDDQLNGGGGTDRLRGGGGLDTLTGSGGGDTFVFDQALVAGNVATVADFAPGSDVAELSLAVFTAAGPAGVLAANAFHVGTAAHDADDRIVYNAATGALLYDADGTGAQAAVAFAVATPGLPLTAGDFRIV